MDDKRLLDCQVAERVIGFRRWVFSVTTLDRVSGGAVLMHDAAPQARPDLWRKQGLDEVGAAVELNDLQDFVPRYSEGEEIEAVVRVVRAWRFSQRQRFCRMLQQAVSQRMGMSDDYALHAIEVPLWMEPQDICVAAIATLDETVPG